MSHHIIEFKDVEYSYPDETKALDKISFRITHGESIAFIGANGAGKSTLLLHLPGILKHSAGEITIGEIQMRKETIQRIRQSVGMVFQNPDDQLFMPRVYDDVAFGPSNMRLSAEEVEKRVIESLKQVGAEHLINKAPYKLSTGEKRAAAIASVLSMKPDILVLDEPCSSLDPHSRRVLINLLLKFSHTKIIATHDMSLAKELCSRVIILEKGKILADGTPDIIFNDKKLLEKARIL